MMKRLPSLILFVVLVYNPVRAQAPDSASAVFENACKAAEAGRFMEAVEGFEKLAASGHDNADVQCNLGIAWLQSGHVGKSVLHLERALQFDPGAADIQDNLAVAQSRRKDSFEPLPMVFVIRWWNGLKRGTTPSGILLWAGLFLWLAAGSAYALFGVKRIIIRQIGLVGVAVASTLTILALFMYFDKTEDLAAHREAVVMIPEIEMKANADPGAERIVLLHEGTVFEVLETKEGWASVRLPDGRTGWVLTDTFERI
jgi:tetratricopeptide (TPR) repeat protein